MDKEDFEKVYNDYLHQGEEQAQFEIAQEASEQNKLLLFVKMMKVI